jgi:hypothetical protein
MGGIDGSRPCAAQGESLLGQHAGHHADQPGGSGIQAEGLRTRAVDYIVKSSNPAEVKARGGSISVSPSPTENSSGPGQRACPRSQRPSGPCWQTPSMCPGLLLGLLPLPPRGGGRFLRCGLRCRGRPFLPDRRRGRARCGTSYITPGGEGPAQAVRHPRVPRGGDHLLYE